jgi:hypothetical protein
MTPGASLTPNPKNLTRRDALILLTLLAIVGSAATWLGRRAPVDGKGAAAGVHLVKTSAQPSDAPKVDPVDLPIDEAIVVTMQLATLLTRIDGSPMPDRDSWQVLKRADTLGVAYNKVALRSLFEAEPTLRLALGAEIIAREQDLRRYDQMRMAESARALDEASR